MKDFIINFIFDGIALAMGVGLGRFLERRKNNEDTNTNYNIEDETPYARTAMYRTDDPELKYGGERKKYGQARFK